MIEKLTPIPNIEDQIALRKSVNFVFVHQISFYPISIPNVFIYVLYTEELEL